MLKNLAITGLGAGALALAALGFAGTAGAAGARADDTVNGLQAQGYSVQLSGNPTASLSACTTGNVSGLSDAALSGPNPTAYVEVICPDGC